VAPQQEGQGPVEEVPPIPTSAGTPNTTSVNGVDFGEDVLEGLPGLDLGGSEGATSDPGLPGWVRPFAVVLGLLVLAVGWVLAVPRLVRRRWQRARAAATPAQQVLLSWHEAGAALAPLGLEPQPHETPTEHAHRVADQPRVAGAALRRLAEAATVAAFAPAEVDPSEASRASLWRGEVARKAVAGEAPLRRLVREADPRPLLRPLPRVRVDDAPGDRDLTPVG
jgi:hypothetical protein